MNEDRAAVATRRTDVAERQQERKSRTRSLITDDGGGAFLLYQIIDGLTFCSSFMRAPKAEGGGRHALGSMPRSVFAQALFSWARNTENVVAVVFQVTFMFFCQYIFVVTKIRLL